MLLIDYYYLQYVCVGVGGCGAKPDFGVPLIFSPASAG